MYNDVMPAPSSSYYDVVISRISRYHRLFLDSTVNYLFLRWIYFGILTTTFWIMILAYFSHFVIAYMYAVFLLNLFLRFITPLNFDDICAAHEAANGGTILPGGTTKSNTSKSVNLKDENVYEFMPFLRQMNEFTFWLSATRVTYIALILIQFECFDLPVFWPLLLLYFILLFITTMNQQVKNMIKYKYIPFNFCISISIRPAVSSPPEVQSNSSPLGVEPSSNYLPVNGIATPGDRGEESETIHGSRGEVIKRADGRTTSGGEAPRPVSQKSSIGTK